MATSSITRSAAATPPLDHALSRVRVAAYDLVGPVASCLANAAAVAESSFSGTTCVAIPRAPASRPEIGSPSIANRVARARPARSAIRCRAPAIGSIAVVTSTQRRIAFSAATRKSQANASSKPPPMHHSHCRYLQHLNGAIRNVHVRDKCSEPVDVLSGPFTHLAAEAEVRPLGANHEHAY